MAEAVNATLSSVVGSSVTTVAGFIALCFMSFTLGKDLGVVMAKGVLLGVVGCVTTLPSLILVFDRVLQKTKHRSLIPDAAKADPDIFSSESPRDALADAGLTRTRRSHKEQDGTGLFLIQSHDSQLLDDTLLYLGKAVMILVQDFLGLLQINRGGGFRLPGKGGDKLQIIVEHAVLMAVLALLLHAV